MSHDFEKFELSPRDIRRIAVSLSRCKELKTKVDSSILSFMLIDEMDEPARIQVYCQSGTVGTCRVLNGEVREIFQRKCTIHQVQEIFNQPMSLPNVDPEIFKIEPQEERQPRNEAHNDQDTRIDMNTLCLQKDEEMVDLGLNILASEFDSLMSHFKAIIRDKQRSQRRIGEIYHPKQRGLQNSLTPESIPEHKPMKQDTQIKSMMAKQTQKKKNSSEKQKQATTQIAQQMKKMKFRHMKKKVQKARQQKNQQR